MTEIEVDELLLYDDYTSSAGGDAGTGAKKVYETFLSRALSSSLANEVVSRPPTIQPAASGANNSSSTSSSSRNQT